MKKLVLSIAFMAVCAFGMNAQLTVLKSGNVRIGTETFSAVLPEKSNIGIIQPDNPLVFRADTLAKLNLLGTGAYKSGAYITFGIVKDKGTAVFNCKNNVYLQGGTIENNGKLNVTAHEVTLYGGFSIEKGGVLTICNN